jgi:hypothetical protein
MRQYANAQALAGRVWATRSAWQMASLYKIEGMRGDIVDGTGKNITMQWWFTR